MGFPRPYPLGVKMKKILLFIPILFICGNVFASNLFFGSPGNRVNLTYKTISANTLIKRGQGEIYRLDFQATGSTGSFTICDSTQGGTCATEGLGVVSEGGQATSGNSYSIDYGDRPVQTTVGIYAIVSNGTLIVTYD